MRPLCLALTALLAAPVVTLAQEAVPRGSRPQGDNPQVGTAVPRDAPPPPTSRPDGVRRRAGGRDRSVVVPPGRRTVIVRPAPYGYYYSPYSYYPYGYRSFGLGYFYYDPYAWSPGAYAPYAYGSPRSYSLFDIGELRLDVLPRHAQVFVDGYYAGIVDDFDGVFQAVKLAPGVYRIEIVAPGLETLTVDVRIDPGQKVRYRGELRRP